MTEASDQAGRGEPDALTGREWEVASAVAFGLRNKEIAARLGVCLQTVKGHLQDIFRKLGLPNRAALAAWVARRAEAPTAPPGHPLPK